MSVRRSAIGLGESFFSSRRASTNASIGLIAQPLAASICPVFGTSGRLIGCNDHQSYPARFSVLNRYGSIGSLPHFAPCAIHALIVFRCASGSSFFGGISAVSTRYHIGLSSRSPGTITLPFFPPAIARSRRERSSFAFGSGPLWQSRQ